MTRLPVALAVFAALALTVALDIGGSAPLNPFVAPPAFALGSGQTASGAHCAAPAGAR